MKRICLFAAYDKNNILREYVIDYLKELSQYADIYYLADSNLSETEIDKIRPYVKKAWAFKHGKYDFGSYSELAKNYVGWDEISKYDELIFANDSCFCIQSFEKVFKKMDTKILDVWSLTMTDELNIYNVYLADEYLFRTDLQSALFCLNSNFMVFRKMVIEDMDFQEFIDNVKQESSRTDVCLNYEMGLTKFILNKKYIAGAFIERIYREVFIYNSTALLLLKEGLPLVKTKIFSENPGGVKNVKKWVEIIEHNYNPKIKKYICHFNSFSYSNSGLKKFLQFLEKYTLKKIPYRHEIKEYFKKQKRYKCEESIKGYKPSRIYNYKVVQNKLIDRYINSKNIVLYFSVARDLIGGGILSINRFVEKSKSLSEKFGFEIALSGLPLGNAAIKHSMFQDSLAMLDFNLFSKRVNPEKLLINIPEVFLKDFLSDLTYQQKNWLKGLKELHINILNQNIEFMPDSSIVSKLFDFTTNISITCAHAKYCTQELSNKYCCPVYLLPPFLPVFYRKHFNEKEDIIVISPDNDIPLSENVTKQLILEKLKKELPEFKQVIVENMSIEEYKQLISKAKFSITFGEGYDGYFLEPYLSDSVAFAVFNTEFFPDEFSANSTIYPSWNDLFENIVKDIKFLNSNYELYKSTQESIEKQILKYTSEKISIKYLEDFYNLKPTFEPKTNESILFPIINELKSSGFKFYNDKVETPDGLIFINNRGEFYSVLAEVYLKQDYGVNLKDDFVLIDLGLNVGITSLYFSKKYNNCKKIYGFEPLKPTIEAAFLNMELNSEYKDKICIKNVGLSNVHELRKINFVPDWASGVSSEENQFEHEMFRLSTMKEQIREEEIEIVPASSEFKQIIEQHNDKKIVLKCDIQGAEFEVIEDLSNNNLLEKIDIILLETHFRDSQIIVDYLKKLNFVIFDTIDYIPNNIHMIYAVNLGLKSEELL